MNTNTPTLVQQAIGLGVLAGMRSMSAPAILSEHLSRNGAAQSLGAPLDLLASPTVVNLLKVPAVAEMVADKLPFIPARTEPQPLIGRAVLGALVGAGLYKANQQNFLIGALIGAVAALASTYAAYYLRRTLGERLKLPDFVLALVEDALVVGGGYALVGSGDA